MGSYRNRSRIGQTRRGLNLLQKQIDEWLKFRRKEDRFGQYKTQLNVLEQVLSDALNRLRSEADSLSADKSSNEVYSTCRKHDQRAVWLQRVWRYYRTKFDQRDDGLLGPILAAADEVVWSCYRQAFQQAAHSDPEIKQRPMPLSYIEQLYSPQAIPKDDPPGNLESNIDVDFLKSFLAELPIPIISLPPYCVQAPWWLIYLGHETGHHVQFDLLADWQLVLIYQELIKSTVAAESEAPDVDKRCDRWGKWGKEIFADMFSICSMGPWAAWAMGELEIQDSKSMLLSRALYPSPVVRLTLLKETVSQLKADTRPILSDLDSAVIIPEEPVMLMNRDLRKEVHTDLAYVPAIVEASIQTPLGKLGTLKELCNWEAKNFRNNGTIDYWRDGFLGIKPIIPAQSLSAPRLIACAGVAAWAGILAIEDDAKRSDQREKLARELPKVITENREEGTRSADTSGLEGKQDFGIQLADWLLQTNLDEL